MTLYAATSRLSLLPLQMSGLSMCVCVSRVFFLSKNKLLSSRPTHSVDEVDDDAFAPHLVIKSCAASSFMCLVQNILYIASLPSEQTSNACFCIWNSLCISALVIWCLPFISVCGMIWENIICSRNRCCTSDTHCAL